MVNACLVFFFETGKENKRKERGEKKKKKEKDMFVNHELYFPIHFLPFCYSSSFLRVGGLWREHQGIPCPFQQSRRTSPHSGRLSTPRAGQSAGCGKVQPVWCQAEESWTTALFFPRWVWPVTGYLPFTDLPLMLTRKTERVTHLNLPVFTQNAEGYYSALQLLIPDYLCLN